MTQNNIVNETADLVKDLHKVELMEIGDGKVSGSVMVLPQGKQVTGVKQYLDAYRINPERRKGTARFTTIESFIDHTNRFKDENSALFANDHRDNPSLTSVINYHEKTAEGKPQFGDHRGVFSFPLSDEWKIWHQKNGETMNQVDFAEFLENRIADVIVPEDIDPDSPVAKLAANIGGNFASHAKLMELSRGLTIHEGQKVKQAVNISSGETTVQFENQHMDADGQPIKVPNLFLIAIPVFSLGAFYQIGVRLRYRNRSGSITWFYELYRTDKVFDHAFKEACEKAKNETALPLFFGQPE